MFDDIGKYFSYYYNYYFNSSENKSTFTDICPLITNNAYKYNISMLETNESYKLVFSKNKTNDEDIPKIIEISLYKYYNNDDLTQNSHSSSFTFVHSNKFLKINSKINMENYMKTINIIRNYNIKNVILPEYIYSNNFKTKEYIEIFPYYPYGDLYEYYTNNNLYINEITCIYKQIIDIIADYHNIGGISHRDLKLENFVFSFDKNNNIQVKLIDLDFSCLSKTHFKFHGGTIQYCSYELINNISFKTWTSNDIWSLTVVLYILLFNSFPWINAIDENIFDTENVQTCDIFRHYLLHNNSTYWYKKLKKINLNSKEFSVFNKILNYGFNINHEERTDINYIKTLLSEL